MLTLTLDNGQHTLYRYSYQPATEHTGDTMNESEDYGNNGDSRPADSGICGGTP